MSDWFTKNRLAMQTNAQTNLLKYGVTGTSTVDDMLALDEKLEKFNNDIEHSDEDGGLLQAMAAEVVSEMDEVFVNQLVDDAANCSHFEMSMTDVMSGNIAKEMANQVNDKANHFYIANPLIVSLLQSVPEPIFVPAEDGFRGPNNTILVGTVNDVRVFCYIYSADASYNQDMGAVIFGQYHPETESFTSSMFTIADSGGS